MIPVVVGSSPIGHPKLSPAKLFASAQRSALAKIEANRAGVLAADDPEYLHQLRVGLRRLRSALRVFRDVLPRKASKRLARRARRVMRETAAARDWDVVVAWLDGERASRSVLARARRKRDRARAAARAAVSRARLEAVEPEAGTGFSAAPLERLERKVRKQARRMDWSDAGDRHELRVRVKQLRYACEFLGARRPALERLQQVLGELNDVEVARRLLDGELDQRLERRERSLLRALERMKTSSFGQASGRRG